MMVELTRTQIEEALPRVARGLEQYLWLQEHRDSGDILTDTVFRRRFNGFYRVRRATKWQDKFYRLLQKKKAQPVTFGQALRALHRATGCYEASFASKLVATIRPEMPVIDSAAKQATNTVPIVFIVEPDPVGTGLVASLAHPGGNITGISDSHADLVPKRLELLKEVVPRATRVGVLLNPANHNAPSQLKTAQAAGAALSLTVVPVEVKGPAREDLDRAFATMGRERLAALLVLGDSALSIHRTRIAELAIKHRLPTAGTARAWAEGGLLMAYGANFIELFRRAATYVDIIVKGAKPADLPVEQPTTFNLVINLKTAKALGVTLPPSLLLRASEVIQ